MQKTFVCECHCDGCVDHPEKCCCKAAVDAERDLANQYLNHEADKMEALGLKDPARILRDLAEDFENLRHVS